MLFAIAGSTTLGNYVVLAGQTGIVGHLNIGSRVTVAARAGVMNDIPDGEKWWGTPAQPVQEVKRQIVALRQLPELLKRVSALERKSGEDQLNLPAADSPIPDKPPA